MWLKILFISVIYYISSVQCNLEGPFLFFGPKNIEKFKRPALKYLEQDDLMKIYSDQAAIVVFNNQDSVPLSSGYFPRLRKMVEGQPMLVLPQDFLDVHPDYVSNETQVLTLQGPWSERDAQMTETFARLQDIYGEGRVLGILGNSVSQSAEFGDGVEWNRVRRQADEEEEDRAPEEEKTTKSLPRFALYNATGPPGKGALLYSSRWPELRLADGSVTVLSNPVGQPTVKPTRLYTNLVVRFVDGNSTNKATPDRTWWERVPQASIVPAVDRQRDVLHQITLEFSFKQSGGWWQAVGVEVKRGLMTSGLNLQAPAPPDAPAAVLGKAYACSLPLVYSSSNGTLTFADVKMQVFMESTEEFADVFDCIGFTTVPIWSGIMCCTLILFVLGVSIIMIMDIRPMDRFENSRSKQLVVTVQE